MKNVSVIIVFILITVSLFALGFNYKNSEQPNNFYQVYIDDEIIGTIKSKRAFENYITERNEYIKNLYNVSEVYIPNGMEIKKITTFSSETDSIKKVYERAIKLRAFTIDGYQITLKNGDKSQKIFVTKEDVFKDAVTNTIKTFVGTEKYDLYISGAQEEIKVTGRTIENVYVEEDITIKKTRIPVDEIIYKNASELSKYLLFGTTVDQKKYIVKSGDTIEGVAFANQISVEEFLISNPTFTNSKNLLFPGQEVIIGITNPQVRVVTKEYVVKDIVEPYDTEYITDSTLYVGQKKIVRSGTNGLIRVTQEETSVNGNINIVSDPLKREELKTAVNQIIKIGDRPLPSNVGSLYSWGWPTKAGWTVTSGYGWRISPISGRRELHDAIDIAGTGYGSPIYATNNGTVTASKFHSVNGNYIIINHNNGYYTLYAHLQRNIVESGDTVVRGQIIGYMGHTGWSTGTHLHYAIYNTRPLSGTPALNPWRFY